jgi:TatD DNase family protein
MYIDSHCHLTFPELLATEADVFRSMQQAQVTHALCVCTTLEEFPTVHGLAKRHPHVWCTVGVHPDNEGVQEPRVDDLLQAAQSDRVIAIGETGLDYYQMEERKGGRGIADMEWQRERFRTHIRAAQQTRLPLVVHTREASDDTLRILREEGEGEGQAGRAAGGVFHCFTENLEVARAALDLGFYISLSGIVTFKSARQIQEVAAWMPLERMLIETDSPYLAPVPHRGKRNEPAFVAHVAEFIAQLRGVPVAQVAEQTTRNFFTLFSKAKADDATAPHAN